MVFMPTHWNLLHCGREENWKQPGVYACLPGARSVELRFCGSPFLRRGLKSAVILLQGLDKDFYPCDFRYVASDYSLERLSISPTLSKSEKNVILFPQALPELSDSVCNFLSVRLSEAKLRRKPLPYCNLKWQHRLF